MERTIRIGLKTVVTRVIRHVWRARNPLLEDKRNKKTGKSWKWIDGYHFEDGTDCNMFVIVFSGYKARLMINPYDFMSVTRLMNHPRIYLYDKHKMWYQNGINRRVSNFRDLCGLLAEKFEQSSADKLLILGTSSGGFAALLAGHVLGADTVHAFGPQTNISMNFLREPSIIPLRTRLTSVANLYCKQWQNRDLFDLRKALARYNGTTHYYVHYCSGNSRDRRRAEHIADLPGVKALSYPCDYHAVVKTMLEDGYLQRMFSTRNAKDPRRMTPADHAGERLTRQDCPTKEISRGKIAEMISGIAAGRPDPARVVESQDLVAEFALDSLTFLQLLVKLENTFDVRFNRNDPEMYNFRSVEEIRRIVERARDMH